MTTRRRELFEDEHEAFRDSARRWIDKEIVPHLDEWELAGIVPRELYLQAGEHGFLAMAVPERYGGAGVEDFRFNVVLNEEFSRAGVGAVGLGLTLHNDICLPYFLSYCDEEQRERWLPGIVTGELITAIAMTEPGMGSDLADMRARAKPAEDGYVLNGAKTFITNGINADLVITAAKTDPTARHRGISLMIVERGMEGFERGRNLEKVGQHCQDTAELFFTDVRVPAENLLGDEGQGFFQLVSNLPQERMSIAVAALASAEQAIQWTLQYTLERKAFGRPIGTFQNSRFALAEMHTEVEVSRAFLDRCVARLGDDELSAEDAAMAKWWCTELQGRIMDRCLQLHGGYGYMVEYPIARAWADARITRIYGGTTEVMKEIVGRSLGLGDPKPADG
jgi:alkylation response protein AidB-like acyl-CoA dehydrogenase